MTAEKPLKAVGMEILGMTIQFGAITALDDVSIRGRPGSFHALLGEAGAGKSTLVECIMGFYPATSGDLLVAGHEARIDDPRHAQAMRLGMVYQRFTLVALRTAAEKLVISRDDTPKIIDWRW